MFVNCLTTTPIGTGAVVRVVIAAKHMRLGPTPHATYINHKKYSHAWTSSLTSQSVVPTDVPSEIPTPYPHRPQPDGAAGHAVPFRPSVGGPEKPHLFLLCQRQAEVHMSSRVSSARQSSSRVALQLSAYRVATFPARRVTSCQRAGVTKRRGWWAGCGGLDFTRQLCASRGQININSDAQ